MRVVVLLLILSSVSNIALSQVKYPFPIKKFSNTIEAKNVTTAFMDVSSDSSNGKSVLLLHGKNFNGYYWKDIIPALSKAGYRVIIPDQPGWGKSDKPDIHYSFHLLAANTKALLDHLSIEKVMVIGHSMGGMLATRFALMYPDVTEKLVLENPIGLEDYKLFVPYQSTDQLYKKEKVATYESYRKYQQSYYPIWQPEYEQYVQAQAEQLKDPDFTRIAFINALTYQMIYEQPVIYELSLLTSPTLMVIGQEDRTVVGKDQLSEVAKKQYGQYPALGKKAAQQAKAKLVELPAVGHIPHIQAREVFLRELLSFLRSK